MFIKYNEKEYFYNDFSSHIDFAHDVSPRTRMLTPTTIEPTLTELQGHHLRDCRLLFLLVVRDR